MTVKNQKENQKVNQLDQQLNMKKYELDQKIA